MTDQTSLRSGRNGLARWLGPVLFLVGAIAPGFALAADPVQLRASYILTLAKFVQWPESALAGSDRFGVCVQGDEVLNAIAAALRDKQVGERPMPCGR